MPVPIRTRDGWERITQRRFAGASGDAAEWVFQRRHGGAAGNHPTAMQRRGGEPPNGDAATRRGTTQRRRSDAAWFWRGRWVCGGFRVDTTRTVEREAPRKKRCVAASMLGKGSSSWASTDGHAQRGGFSNGGTAARRTQRRRSGAAGFWRGRWVCGGFRVEATRTVEREAPKKTPRRCVAVGEKAPRLGLRRWVCAAGQPIASARPGRTGLRGCRG